MALEGTFREKFLAEAIVTEKTGKNAGYFLAIGTAAIAAIPLWAMGGCPRLAVCHSSPTDQISAHELRRITLRPVKLHELRAHAHRLQPRPLLPDIWHAGS